MATKIPENQLDIQEQVARIKRLMDESEQRQAEMLQTHQEMFWKPWQFVIAALGTGAGFFAVALAYAKYIIG